MEEYSKLAIEQTATTTKVTGESGQMLAVYPIPERMRPNSSTDTSSSSPGSNSSGNSGGDSSSDSANIRQPPTAEWQGAQLVWTEQAGHRGETTRTYELSPDGKQLYVTTKMDNPRFKKPAKFRFVYDPAPSGG